MIKGMIFCFVMWLVLSALTIAYAAEATWDIGDNWTDETKVVLILTDPSGVSFRLDPVPARDGKQHISNSYFDFGKEYTFKAIAFNSEKESDPSEEFIYKHRDGPKVLEIPIAVKDKPDTLVIKITYE